MSEVTEKQAETINNLTTLIRNFINNAQANTRVIPISLPTGWGKTRVSIRSLIGTSERFNSRISVILWPQAANHVEEVWSNSDDWPSENRTYDWNNMFDSNSGLDSNAQKRFYYVNSNYDPNLPVIRNHLINEDGAVVFIVDEWHGRKWIEKYDTFISNNPEATDEDFWRNLLLPEGFNRKLLVLLVSATPIATTRLMDDLDKDTFSNDVLIEEVNNAYSTFAKIIQVGNQNHEYELFKTYPALIKSEAAKLKQKQNKYNPVNNPNVYETHRSWIQQYNKYCNENYIDSRYVYLQEQMLFTNPNSPSKKLEACKDLISHYPRKRFVIFCRHIEIAENLETYLLDNDISVKYISDKKRRYRKESIEAFNHSETNLILTDRDSQGISLQKSDAWLIHYELAWNPIRIIQRFGRVWRIKYNENRDDADLTHPLAFYLPFTGSSEEEMVRRLKRRWQILESLDEREDVSALMKISPIPIEVALGIRYSPE